MPAKTEEPAARQVAAPAEDSDAGTPGPAARRGRKRMVKEAPETAPAPASVPPMVKVAEATPAPAQTSPPAPPAVATTYPGLPGITLSSVVRAGDADRHQLALAAQWAAASGDWPRHYSTLLQAMGNAVLSGPPLQHAWNLESMLTAPTASLAMEQAGFIRAVSPATLTAFSADPDNREFLDWLFARPNVLSAFNGTIQPKDKALNALKQWRNIWSEDPDNRDSLSSLAIACALVFDEPVRINPDVFGFGEHRDYQSQADDKPHARATTEATALSRFRFFRDSAKRGVLKTNLPEMMPWELVWVVDAPVPESELLWAQQHLNFSRREWSKAYPHIRYRMDRATQGVNPYKAYTLAEIEKEGGICGDQAYFASISAKANGIPAMAISGEGDRGAHAWFGYEIARNEWNLTTGRYADNYAAGTTRNPQTGATIKEHELRQLTDPVRRTAAYEKSQKLLALGTLMEEAKHHELATLADDSALRLAPKNYQAWQLHLDYLAAAKTPTADWLRESARMRAVFHEYADLEEQIQKREAAYVAQNSDADAARDLVHRQTARLTRKDGERTDLILDGVFQEADLAMKSGDTQSVGRIYRDALRDKGTEMVAFKKIASHYYNWAKANSQGPETVQSLVSYFDRKHPEPTGDVFAMGAYRDALKELSRMAKEQNLESVEKRLDHREEKIDEAEKKLGKLQSKNADR